MAQAWTLVARPQGMPTLDDFALIALPDRSLAVGEVRIANRWLSVDPYMRGRMNDVKSYVPPFVLGEPMQGGAVGEVIESRAAEMPVGAMVRHMAGWRDEAALPAAHVQPLPDDGVGKQAYLGTLGMPGMTAWFGLLAVASAREGDTVFVSAAAGAVGSTVVQLAKARGMRVVGSAGGPAKCDWVRSIGADATIDYKAVPSLTRALTDAAPSGIDVYFDNVGGAHLDAALGAARLHARFAICGMIDVYNIADRSPLRFLTRLIGARVRMEGFIVSDFLDREAEFQDGMAALLRQGSVVLAETVKDGLDAAPEAFLALFTGGNTGKMLVKL